MLYSIQLLFILNLKINESDIEGKEKIIMKKSNRLWEEQEDIEDINRSLQDAGVSELDPNDELNIDLAEHRGWPPKHL